MPAIREVRADGWCVRLGLAGQVLRLEIPESEEHSQPLLPLLPRLRSGPVSAATLLLKAKQFDDGLLAAVEIASQNGAGRFAGKTSLLQSLTAAFSGTLAEKDRSASAFLLAACKLGDNSLPIPALQGEVQSLVEEFLRDELASKPLGFYTWSPDLKAIFRQGRLLQRPLDEEMASALVKALDSTPNAWETYNACLRLASRLTNPLTDPGLGGNGADRAFFPASRSHEVTLFERLYRDRHVPEGFDLMTELIRGVQAGKISLQPTEVSGWTDYQTWSLAPLLVPESMPEAPHLELGKRYRQHLEDLFRGALALIRESHAKQSGGGRGGYCGTHEQPIWIYPSLTIEPLPWLYARRAASYRFVQLVLKEEFGAGTLQELHRLTLDGQNRASLAEELNWIQKLFDGAAATAAQELGLEPADGSEDARRCFAEWREKQGEDPDVKGDARMMVPVFYDIERRMTKVWALLGWRTVSVTVDYRVPPTVLAVEPAQPSEAPPRRPPPVQFRGERFEFAEPVMAEVYVEKLLDRDEFRRHCGRYQTRSAILANLQ